MPSRSSESIHETDLHSTILFASSVIATLAFTWIQKQNKKALKTNRRRNTPVPEIHLSADQADHYYLQLAQQYRLQLQPPLQSHFRVVALLLLDNGQLIYGTNDEPSPNISLSMCAERCAFLRYRAQGCKARVEAVYIVTDAETTVAPGTACREFMWGHPATRPTTRMVLQSQDSNSPSLSIPLKELLPYPPIFAGMTPEEQLQWGEEHKDVIHAQIAQLKAPKGLSQSLLHQLIQSAYDATELDQKDSVHALRYGAAVAIQMQGKKRILRAFQIKALEYSSTLDAVGQLAGQISTRLQTCDSTKVLAVVQVDQFGIPHGLFAQARAFFVEHGLGDCAVILTGLEEGDGTSPQVLCVPAKELAPLVPEFRS